MDIAYTFGISTTVDYMVPIERQISLISQNGFKFISLGADLNHSRFFDRDSFIQLLELVDSKGIFLESIHIPFDKPYNIAAKDKDVCKLAIDNVIKFVDLAGEHKIPIVILHPHSYIKYSKESVLDRVLTSMDNILGSKPASVHLAIENLPTGEGSWICGRLLDSLDASQIGFCYDSSHENISGEPFHLLRNYFDRLTTCHLSDNNGRSDEHLIPGIGNINWIKLKKYFDKSNLIHILFEVGTGEKLKEPLDIFLRRTFLAADKIFMRGK